jgi:adenylyltransferase/sulfurtransferase
MEDIESRCASLRAQIAATETQLATLKQELEAAEKTAAAAATGKTNGASSEVPAENGNKRKWPLSGEEYKRYGRQMIVPQVGLQG